jgi:hypothetical protein
MQKANHWSKNNNLLRLIYFIGVLILPMILYLIPLEWIRHQHSICIFKNIIGFECYGCGMFRAILSALHLQIKTAFMYNKLVGIILPLLGYIWAKTIITVFKIKNE